MPLIRKTPAPPGSPSDAGDLHSASADARWAAARRLASPEDVPALSTALERETEPRVREAIFTSLARIGGVQSARALAERIRSDEAALRTGAIDALRSMGPEREEVLAELLADPDGDVRLLACEIARQGEGERSGPLLCDLLLRETEPNVAAAAVEVLTEIGDSRALPALERCGERFAGEPFLAFAIRIARERIGAK